MYKQIDPNYIENTVFIDSLNIDPFEVMNKDSVWITGGYALKRYIGGNWLDGDIDYTVRDEETRKKVLEYFDRFSNSQKTIGRLGTVTYIIGPFKVQILPDMYEDPRKRFFQHDLSICQIAHDGTQYIMSKICYEHIKRKIFTKVHTMKMTEERIHKYIERGFYYEQRNSKRTD